MAFLMLCFRFCFFLTGGLCLHTILRSQGRMHLGISTGGHYISDDGGKKFNAANDGIGAGFVPDPNPEFGQSNTSHRKDILRPSKWKKAHTRHPQI